MARGPAAHVGSKALGRQDGDEKRGRDEPGRNMSGVWCFVGDQKTRRACRTSLPFSSDLHSVAQLNANLQDPWCCARF